MNTLKKERPRPEDPGRLAADNSKGKVTKSNLQGKDEKCQATSKEFASIGLVKKNMKLDKLVKMADELNVHLGFLVTFYEKMYKITEKFLEIENRLAALEANRQARREL